MKFKTLFLIALICTVFTAACLDSNKDPTNPLNKKIKPFETAYPENVPFSEEIILYRPWSNSSCMPGYTLEGLPTDADVILYGTLKSINPSLWSTVDHNPPPTIFDSQLETPGKGILPGKATVTFKNGTQVEYNTAQLPGCDNSIYTIAVFKVNDMVKGENATEINVVIPSGQVGNHIAIDSFYPTIWDLEVGQQYLIYLQTQNINGEFYNYGTEDNTALWIMQPGLLLVVE